MQSMLAKLQKDMIGTSENTPGTPEIGNTVGLLLKDLKVPGFCVKGCGKPVAPGLTKNGNPYKTCCRGCALGFGHDLRCGLKDGERPPCKMGCGMLAAPGKTAKGRALDTCCRGCAKGGEHDVRCSQDAA